MGTTFTDLTVAGDGTLWWVDPGLTRFDPATGSVRTFTVADDAAFDGAGPIASAGDGGVWIVASDGSVRRFDGTGFRQVIDAPGVCSVLEGPDSSLFATSCDGGGVLRLDDTTWVPLPSEGRPEANAELETFDASGALWVSNDRFPGPKGMGVSRFDGSAWTTWTTREGLPSDDVFAIDGAPNGDVWVGARDGVARFTEGRWIAYPGSETGISNVRSLVATATEVWIAGFNGDGQEGDHAARFDGTAWAPVTFDGTASTGGTFGIQFARGPSSVWATANGTVYRLDGSSWTSVTAFPGWSGAIGAITSANGNELWVSAWSDGAWRLDGETRTRWRELLPGWLSSDTVNGIAVGEDRAVWAATSAGLARFDGSGWQEISAGDHQAIALGPDGVPWTARADPDGPSVGRVGGARIPEPVPLVSVRTLAVASDRDVWAGTAGYFNGLAHFDGDGWTSVTPVEGQPNFGVLDIQVAPKGDIWVALVPFDPATPSALDPLVVARFDGSGWTVYRDADGVPFGNINDGSIGDLAISPSGVPLLTAGPGLLEFHHDRWSLLQEGRFSHVSVAPDGTIWLAGDGLFRLPERVTSDG